MDTSIISPHLLNVSRNSATVVSKGRLDNFNVVVGDKDADEEEEEV